MAPAGIEPTSSGLTRNFSNRRLSALDHSAEVNNMQFYTVVNELYITLCQGANANFIGQSPVSICPSRAFCGELRQIVICEHLAPFLRDNNKPQRLQAQILFLEPT